MTPAVVGLTGMARYAQMLWDGLASCDGIDVRGFAFGRGRRPGAAISYRRIPLRVVHPIWKALKWPKAEHLVGDVDVVHSLELVPPPTRRPLVVTVNDVLPLSHPEFYPRRSQRLYRAQCRALPRAQVIITPTVATADEIVRVASVSRDRLVIVPLAGAADAAPGPSLCPEPYVLAVGVITPRKGLEVLARAAALLDDEVPVVVAGPDGWEAEAVRRRCRAIAGDRLRFLGAVDAAGLAALYAHAAVVAHPSLGEGFGMVCVEAMGHGRPVVAADVPAVREVTGAAAVLVAPGDHTALAQAVGHLLVDEAESARRAEAGRARAALYTWESFVAGTVAAYRMALEHE